MNPTCEFDWADLAFASKKPLRELNATFIAAPRDLSPARLKQLIRTYLPQGDILLGLSKEDFVLGLEGQPQFRMLTAESVRPFAKKIAEAPNAPGKTMYKLYLVSYAQRDLPFILEKLAPPRAVFVNGSWYHAFHLRPEFYALAKHRIPYELISPFASEDEAKDYTQNFQPLPPSAKPGDLLTETEMLETASVAAKQSFAYSEHQTGVALGRQKGTKYELLTTAFNRVVPYQTYAMHHGASREQNFSPSNDLNYYDVNHAEVELIAAAAREHLDLSGTALFINLLPCPTCARMFTSTDIAEFIYSQDHSDGYAVRMLEAAGKTVRRLIA